MNRTTRHRSSIGLLPARGLFAAAVALIGFAAACPARGDEGRAEKLRPMRAIAERVEVESTAPGEHPKMTLSPEPFYLWDDPARRLTQGGLWGWGASGRPGVILTTSIQRKGPTVRYWLCEMTSLSSGSLSVAVPSGKVWEPGPGLEPRPFPGAPAPADDEPKRLRQMKDLARRFKAFEFYEPSETAATERYELRLLPQPIRRYSDEPSGLVDGSMFLLTYGQNPEIVLTIEASRAGRSGPVWTYGLARTGSARMIASLDGTEVWQQPRLRVRHGVHDPYWVFVMPVTHEPPPAEGGSPDESKPR